MVSQSRSLYPIHRLRAGRFRLVTSFNNVHRKIVSDNLKDWAFDLGNSQKLANDAAVQPHSRVKFCHTDIIERNTLQINSLEQIKATANFFNFENPR